MKNIVISIGGSVVLSKEADTNFLQKLADIIQKMSKNSKIYIIVGGGNISRTYIKLGRELKLNEETLDLIGIDITRVNARVLTNLLKDSNKEIPHLTDEAIKKQNQIIVMGGTTPGHSTDMVGAEISEKINADLFIIATNVDGIYDNDPNKYSNAVQIKEIGIDDLIKKFGTKWDLAGKNTAIDGPALSIIKKAKIPTVVLNGKKLDQLENAINGMSFNGTRIIV